MAEKSSGISEIYNSLSEAEKSRIRTQVMAEAGISLQQFYYIVRKGTSKKLLIKTFSKSFKRPAEELFQN